VEIVCQGNGSEKLAKKTGAPAEMDPDVFITEKRLIIHASKMQTCHLCMKKCITIGEFSLSWMSVEAAGRGVIIEQLIYNSEGSKIAATACVTLILPQWNSKSN